MESNIVQLKPYEEAFYSMARRIRRLDSIIVCEGKSDAKILKSIVKKIGVECRVTIGVSHGEGQPSVDELVEYVIVLSRLSKRLRSIGLVINSEELTPHNKYLRIINKLERRRSDMGFSSIEEIVVKENFYVLRIIFDQKEIILLIAISGLSEYPFKHHMIEDHALELAFKEGRLNESIIGNLDSSKDAFQNENEIISLINEADKENVIVSFHHLVELIRYVCEVNII
ncbi:MAG: hypothetical protein B6U89_07525 [Desulfurococcales archaeon ex4484_58]|nr:MAG: hypothetical protein B6U89_07525 [Desulfurococcales archaeon ex4484_58]